MFHPILIKIPIEIVVNNVNSISVRQERPIKLIRGVNRVAILDIDLKRAQTIAYEFNTKVFASHYDLIGQVQAVSVATPTANHYEITSDLLSNGIDVLCEKPISLTLEQADSLIDLANNKKRILQIGHLERFNPAVEELFKQVIHPLFIECNRIAPFKNRGIDIDVALDLMIHDIDIILSLVGLEPVNIQAVGVPILGVHPDIVNARLEFTNGCIANVSASRLALKEERKMRIFQPNAYISLDFKKRKLITVTGIKYKAGKIPSVKSKRLFFAKSDPLKTEIQSFLNSVRTRSLPLIGGVEGRRALACALIIRRCICDSFYGRESFLEMPRRWINTSF